MPEDIEEKVKGAIKKQPPWVWFVALGTASVGTFLYIRGRANATTAPSGTLPDGISLTDLAGLPVGYDNSQGASSPFPMIQGNGNSVPQIPFGESPIYDPNGNLIGWQDPNHTPPPVPNPGQPPPPPIQLPSWLPKIPLGSTVWQGSQGRWWFRAPGEDKKAQHVFTPAPNTFIWQGSSGRWWFQTRGGPQQELTAEPTVAPTPPRLPLGTTGTGGGAPVDYHDPAQWHGDITSTLHTATAWAHLMD